MDADDDIDRLIAELELKWGAARGKKANSAEAQEYAAAAHWAAPRLIAEIRRLRGAE